VSERRGWPDSNRRAIGGGAAVQQQAVGWGTRVKCSTWNTAAKLSAGWRPTGVGDRDTKRWRMTRPEKAPWGGRARSMPRAIGACFANTARSDGARAPWGIGRRQVELPQSSTDRPWNGGDRQHDGVSSVLIARRRHGRVVAQRHEDGGKRPNHSRGKKPHGPTSPGGPTKARN
jgi:hypothetical protein